MQESMALYSKVLFCAYADWLGHLSRSPQKQQNVTEKSLHILLDLLLYSTKSHQDPLCQKCVSIDPADHRFQDYRWQALFPFNFYAQSFLCAEHLLNEISTDVPGVSPHHAHIVNFSLRQVMDVFSPSNFAWTNPVVMQASFAQAGMNFFRGALHLWEDVSRGLHHQLPAGTEGYQLGLNIACTPGQVIYRNALIELIQYSPTTQQVYPEPILIIPAWIMKYYILDLEPYHSLVKYLVGQGHTVFMISWKNPDANDSDLGLEDYLNLGVMDALKVINTILPDQPIHATGYCIGGTLLMLAAALMAESGDERLKTITLFAAQVDFKEAGELRLFIDEEQIKALEALMQRQGYLSGEQMASCFSMLHARDLIWSHYIQEYMLGVREPLSDMMAWDADTTRLPCKMHSEYLRKLYLNNEFARGQLKMAGKKLALAKIKTPLFVVSTARDHVAPWPSVYKIHDLTKTEMTFVLTQGGHNYGIINEPGRPDQHYQMRTHKKLSPVLTHQIWQTKARHYKGSWWSAWQKWLVGFSSALTHPPRMGHAEYPALCPAPGQYVLKR